MKNFELNGTIISGEDWTKDEILNQFLEFLENVNCQFLGIIKEIDE